MNSDQQKAKARAADQLIILEAKLGAAPRRSGPT